MSTTSTSVRIMSFSTSVKIMLASLKPQLLTARSGCVASRSGRVYNNWNYGDRIGNSWKCWGSFSLTS